MLRVSNHEFDSWRVPGCVSLWASTSLGVEKSELPTFSSTGQRLFCTKWFVMNSHTPQSTSDLADAVDRTGTNGVHSCNFPAASREFEFQGSNSSG